ncbi:MAG: response regulator [Ignavibacteriaceae bacterium]|nr:response regulator [Ignavibacteriaceae bacterium]
MNILLIEDDLGLTELIKEIIAECGFQFVHAQSAGKALERLADSIPDFMILDYSLPDMNGKEFITELQKSAGVIPPFIVTTGQGDEDIAVDMMKLGAKDYLIKNRYFLNKLPDVVKRIHDEIENEKKRKIAEDALYRSEEQFRQLVFAMQVGVVLQGPASQIFLCNPRALELLGLSENQLLGKTSFDPDWNVIHEDGTPFPGATHPVPQSIAARKPVRNVVMGVHSPLTKNRVWIQVDAVPELNLDGTVRHVVCTFTDISDRKEAEGRLITMNEQLQESGELLAQNLTEKNKLVKELTEIKEKLEKLNSEKDKFFSIIAHDLRNPFQHLVNTTELLLSELGQNIDPSAKELATIIHNSARYSYGLLEDLLLWSRSQMNSMEYSPQNIPLSEYVQSELKLTNNLADKKGIKLTVSIPKKLNVYADENMLKFILRNLLTNAIKFTKRGGTIKLSAGKTKSHSYISVEDTGIGMTKSEIDSLFKIGKRYSSLGTEKEKGTGLGLVLCNEFIKYHGGKIVVKSKIDQGSNFKFTLPFPNKNK